MNGDHISIVLLSTNKCNAACDYCFEDKSGVRLTLDKLSEMIEKMLCYMDEKSINRLTVHWQGGEAMLLPPSWYEQAYQRISALAIAHGKQVDHGLQTNMLLYHQRWNPILETMFGNSISTSIDYPNLYRRLPGQPPDGYNPEWHKRVRAARDAGIDVKVISVPNQATIDVGAEEFYEYITEELGVDDFQVNTPFPGGEGDASKEAMPKMIEGLTGFYLDLADIWIERGYDEGVLVGPFDELLNWFSHKPATLPCIWSDNCTNHIISMDARGDVALCDCWVTSYPEKKFGNILEPGNLSDMLEQSESRKAFIERPIKLMEKECIECDYLTLCHGGCPVRTFTMSNTIFQKDPYCELYKALFKKMQTIATRLARESVKKPLVEVA